MNLRYSSLRPVALALVIMLAGVDTALASSSQTQQTDINAAATSPAQSSAPQDQNQRPMPTESVSPLQQTPLPPPQGTAAAPDLRPEGSPASRPAGAAVAASKQKRTHSFAIRVGLLVGAGVAIGTVIALSAGSSSRPQ